GSAVIDSVSSGGTVSGSSSLTSTGHADIQGPAGVLPVSATVLSGTPVSGSVDPAAAGLPATLTADQIADLNNGRLPVGVRSGASTQSFDVSYIDTVT